MIQITKVTKMLAIVTKNGFPQVAEETVLW